MQLIKPSRITAKLLMALLLAWVLSLAWQIVSTGKTMAGHPAEAAIVLGAAVYNDRPSPVFEERLRHAVNLYKTGRVATLLFTGGYGDRASMAESLVAKRYAIGRGVSAEAILVETHSHTTLQNLIEARRLMRAHHMDNALIVSDPLHMKRALRICSDLGIKAAASPTPTSRYRSWRSKTGFLLREIFYYHVYLIAEK